MFNIHGERRMKLTEMFNQFAGKVVKNSELKAKLDAAKVAEVPVEQTQKKVAAAIQAGYLDEIKTLMENLENSMYMSSKGLAELEKSALQVEHPLFLEALLKNAAATYADEIYVDVHPAVQMAALVSDDLTLRDAYVKAAEECTDYRDKVGTDIEPLKPAMEIIVEKALAKFDM